MSVRLSITTAGVRTLQLRMSNRANFLGSNRVGQLLSDLGKSLVQDALQLEARLTPGAARDLSPQYKVQKKHQVGRVYPILWRTGAWLSSMFSQVRRPSGAGWSIQVGFRGQHPGGHISNQRLYEIHAANGRNILNPPKGWTAPWMRRLQTELSRVR